MKKTNIYNTLFKVLYKLFCLFKINNTQCVFCSMEGTDTFNNLLTVKKHLSATYSCFSCFGKVDSLYKVFRTAHKLAQSKFIFLNAAYTYTSMINIRKETKVIQLWHAAGAFKKFGMHSISQLDMNSIKKQASLHGYYDYVITSSASIINIYSEAFNIDRRKILPLGLPRIQALIKNSKNYTDYKNWLCLKYEKLWYKKIILYAPTFREDKGKRNYKPTLNIKNFADQLPDDYILALKLHPRAPVSTVKYPSNVVDISKIPQDIALISADILITDYSSILFDFSVLNKPIFFYTPDEIMYSRGLYFSPKEKYPHLTFQDYYDLANTIILLNKDKHMYNTILMHSKKIRNEYIQNETNTLQNISAFLKTI